LKQRHDNAGLVTNTPIRNSGNTNAVPDELNELTIAFQRADIHRINAIWPALIASHRQLQSTWFSLTMLENTLIVIADRKTACLDTDFASELCALCKEMSVYATTLANIISDNRATISLAQKNFRQRRLEQGMYILFCRQNHRRKK
jgi:ABC-type ATPase involved in cell division